MAAQLGLAAAALELKRAARVRVEGITGGGGSLNRAEGPRIGVRAKQMRRGRSRLGLEFESGAGTSRGRR